MIVTGAQHLPMPSCFALDLQSMSLAAEMTLTE